jgi:hypothetical protein
VVFGDAELFVWSNISSAPNNPYSDDADKEAEILARMEELNLINSVGFDTTEKEWSMDCEHDIPYAHSLVGMLIPAVMVKLLMRDAVEYLPWIEAPKYEMVYVAWQVRQVKRFSGIGARPVFKLREHWRESGPSPLSHGDCLYTDPRYTHTRARNDTKDGSGEEWKYSVFEFEDEDGVGWVRERVHFGEERKVTRDVGEANHWHWEIEDVLRGGNDPIERIRTTPPNIESTDVLRTLNPETDEAV